MATYYNLRHRPVDFKPGDRVWLSAQRGIDHKLAKVKYPSIGPSKHLSPKRLGPYLILRKINDSAFELELPATMRIHPVIHARYLTKRSDTNVLYCSV